MSQNLNNLLWLGTIVNTHGLKGEVRILSDSDTPKERFKVGSSLKYINDVKEGELVIKSFRFHRQFILLTFKGIDHINDIEWIKGSKIYCKKTKLEKGKFYLSDLINKGVVNQEGKTIGIVTSIINQGPYDSLIIKLEDGRTTNIPMVDEFEINFDGIEISTKIPEEFYKKERE